MDKVNLTVPILGTVAMMFIMAASGNPLMTDITPLGIINMSFADTEKQLNIILAAWGPASQTSFDLIKVAKFNTLFDFIYIVFYGWLFHSLCRLIYYRLSKYDGLGWFFSSLTYFTILLDVIENCFILGILNGKYTTTGLKIMATSACLKWIFVMILILYCAVGLYLIWKRRNNDPVFSVEE